MNEAVSQESLYKYLTNIKFSKDFSTALIDSFYFFKVIK